MRAKERKKRGNKIQLIMIKHGKILLRCKWGGVSMK